VVEATELPAVLGIDAAGQTAEGLGLTGYETYDVTGLSKLLVDGYGGGGTVEVKATRDDGSAVDAETVLVTGTASDDRGVARVFVRSGPNVALPATSSDGFRTWTAEVPAGVGTFEVVA
jgi:hypothetical protein